MKKVFLLSSLLILFFAAAAQQKQQLYRNGFYLGMGMGLVANGVDGSTNQGDTFKVRGTTLGFDAQIGYAISPKIMLHVTIQVKSIFRPKINSVKLDDRYAFTESFLGPGITAYTNNNFFATVNAGIANYMFTREDEDPRKSFKATTDYGFSFNIKAGKEWPISPKWALGAAAFFSRTALTSQDDRLTITDKWNSTRFGILFHATFCKTTK